MNQKKQDKVLLSIVIPTYRRPDALNISLSSLSLQDFPKDKYEVVVSNNYPKDTIDAIIDRYKEGGLNITCIDEWRPGAHFARNSGVDVAKGKYIIFMDDDCEADISFLNAYKAAIEEFEPIIAAGRIDISWDSDPPNWVIPFESLMGKIDFGQGNFWLETGQVANGGNLLINREFILHIGGMHTDQVGKLTLGSGDIALSLTANHFGHNVLWVGNAKVWHHQRREINARFMDIFRREFNNGIVTAFELHKKNVIRSRFLPVSARLALFSTYQFLKGVLFINLSYVARSLFVLGRICGMCWFVFFVSRTLRLCSEDKPYDTQTL